MQSVKARKALMDNAILECATSRIWHLFFHISLCYLCNVIRRMYVVRFKVRLKKKSPRITTDKGKIQNCGKWRGKTLTVSFRFVLLIKFWVQLYKLKLCSQDLSEKLFEYGFGQVDVNLQHFYCFNIPCTKLLVSVHTLGYVYFVHRLSKQCSSYLNLLSAHSSHWLNKWG